MPRRLNTDTTVAATIADLFDLTADPCTEEDWNSTRSRSGASMTARSVPAPDGKAATRPSAACRSRSTNTSAQRGWCSRSRRPAGLHWTFNYAPGGPATRLTAAAELTPKGAMRLLSPLPGPMMGRTFAKRPAQLATGVAAQRPPT